MQTNGILKIGDYTITRVLGKGFQAWVYLGHNAAGEFFAIKLYIAIKDVAIRVYDILCF